MLSNLLGELKTENIPQLVLYFMLYQVGNYLWGYLTTVPSYIQCYLFPLFIQTFSMRNYSLSNDHFKLHAYLKDISPHSFNYNYSRIQYTTRTTEQKSISIGRYIMKYKGKNVYLNINSDISTHGDLYITTKISVLSFDKTFFDTLFDEAEKNYNRNKHVYIGKISQRNSGEAKWKMIGDIPKISFKDAIISSENQKRLENAFYKFQNRTKREIDLKIPHRLVILISGSPGFGKTTVIKAIGYEYDLHIRSTSITLYNDSSINDVTDSIGSNTAIIFEDIDAMTSNRNCVDNDSNTKDESKPREGKNETVSLSAFLNFLDGVGTPEGLVVIMTTNCPEKLDPALVRSERVHLHLKFGPDREVYTRFIQRFYPDADADSVAEFANHCLLKKISTASMQSVFRRFEDIAEARKFMEGKEF